MLNSLILSVIKLNAILLRSNFLIMLSVAGVVKLYIMLIFVMLNIVMLNVVMLNVIMLSVVMLSVIKLSFLMLNVIRMSFVMMNIDHGTWKSWTKTLNLRIMW